MRKVVLSVSLMLLASLSTADPSPTPETKGNSPSSSSILSLLSPAPSCETVVPRAVVQPTYSEIGYHFYGYCYSDCSPCWSGNHGYDCPTYSACTEIPLC